LKRLKLLLIFFFKTGTGKVLEEYLESRRNEKKTMTSTGHWLLGLETDIDSLPRLKKARLKLDIQKLLVDAMEDDLIEDDLIEYDDGADLV
jgi:hypothetical protein